MNAIRFAVPGLALLAGLAHFFISVPFFETGPDALNQIVGAFNISQGHGYTLENGDSVRFWPPIYAIYASGFLAFNNSFASLAFGNSLLIAVISFTWSIFILGASNNLSVITNKCASNFIVVKLFAISSATFIILHVLRHPSSDAVFALIFPLFLLTLIKLTVEKWTKSIALLYSIVSVTLVTSHNIGTMLFGAASCAFFITFLIKKDTKKMLTLFLTGIVAVSSWLVVRELFDLSGSHKFEGVFGADRPLSSAAFDLVYGPSDLLFFFWPIGLLILFFTLILSVNALKNLNVEQRDAISALIGTVIIFDILLFITFTSVTISSGIGGRFALVQTLSILMLGVVTTRFLPPKLYLLAVILVALPLLSTGARVAKWYKEYHINGVYQWNRSIILSEDKLNAETISQLRGSTCPDSFCNLRERAK